MKAKHATSWGFPGGSAGKESTCIVGDCLQCRWPRLNPWVGKIPWRRKWQPTPVFLLGKSHGQWRLPGYRPWDHKSWTPLSNWTTTTIIQPAREKRTKEKIHQQTSKKKIRTQNLWIHGSAYSRGCFASFIKSKAGTVMGGCLCMEPVPSAPIKKHLWRSWELLKWV